MHLVIWDGEVFIFILVEYDAYWNSGVSREHSRHTLNRVFFVILVYLYLILSFLFSSIHS